VLVLHYIGYLRCTTIVTRLTAHDDVIKALLRGAPLLGLALGPASARAGSECANAIASPASLCRTLMFVAKALSFVNKLGERIIIESKAVADKIIARDTRHTTSVEYSSKNDCDNTFPR